MTALFLSTSAAHSQSGGANRQSGATPRSGENGENSDGLRARSSTALAARDLGSDNDLLRERALKRLGIASDAQGIELLIRAVQPDGQARTPRLRLVALRSLARFLDDPAVRRALVTLMSGAGQPPEALDDPLETLVRESAAMALAASGHRDALIVLGKSLRQGGPTASAATRALKAYPPVELKLLLTTPGAASTRLVDVLGSLHDQRAFHALRSYVTRGSPEVRARATVVLTEMGHMETIALARHWLKSEQISTVQRLAATRVLVMARSEDSAKHLQLLLEDPEQLEQAARLAHRIPDPRFAPALESALKRATPHQEALLIAAIGRAGGPEAVQALAKLLTGERASEAAYALALTAHPEARDALVLGLSESKSVRVCARALVMRARVLGDEASGLVETLRQLLRHASAGDRATGAFGLAALGAPEAARLIQSRDRDVVIAAARSAHQEPLALAAAERLAMETDATLSLALSNALSVPRARELVPSHVLRRLIQSGSAAASLAARALGARLTSPDEQYAQELSRSATPLMRAEFALGLGESPAPAALGLLREAYEFETDVVVRRAIISAASQRPETTRRHLLELATRLDPDPEVRQLARLAAAGQNLFVPASGTQTFWLELQHNAPGRRSSASPVVVQGSRGHTLVAFADPDGFVGLTGMDSRVVSYVLAEPAE